MPRKSAKGKIKICKALNLDGTKCLKEFVCKQHVSSKHKCCSEKCRKRDHRLKKKKQIHKEQRVLKKLKKQEKKGKSIIAKMVQHYDSIVDGLNIYMNLKKPIEQLEDKSFTDKEFMGIGGMAKYHNYYNRKQLLEKQEKDRKSTLASSGNMIINRTHRATEKFLLLLKSEELKVTAGDRERAVIVDMRNSLLHSYASAKIHPVKGLKYRLLD